MTKPLRRWATLAIATALLGAGYASGVLAETIVVGDKVSVRETGIPRPKGGMSMDQVQKHFGEPRERHPAVGTPPITRWDYDRFAVFFEKDRVIDAVVPGGSSAPAAAPIPAASPGSTSAPLGVSADAPIPAAAPAPHDGNAPKSNSAHPPLSNVALHP